MAIDASIPLMAGRNNNLVDVTGLMRNSAENYDAMKNIPIAREREAIAAQQQQEQYANLQQGQARNESMQKAGTILGYMEQLKNVPMAQRRTFIDTIDPEIVKGLGINPEDFDKFQLDDASIETGIAQLKGALSNSQQQQQVTSRSSDSLAGGRIVRQTMSDGSVVYTENGEQIPPNEVSQRIEAAESAYNESQRGLYSSRRTGANEADLQGKPAIQSAVKTAEREATGAQDYIKEAVPKIASIRQNIKNYDDVIDAIDAGASTGWIQSKLPSFSDASTSLDNLRNSLGLDVVGATTFGALSGSELEFALATALPDTKNPKELKQWVIRKKEAQAKAAEALEGAVAFLNDGNSLADLVAEGKKRRESSQEPAQTQQSTRVSDGARIRNPKTGEVLVLRNGQWVAE